MTGLLRTLVLVIGISAGMTADLSAQDGLTTLPTTSLVLQEPKTRESKTPESKKEPPGPAAPKTDPKLPKIDPKTPPTEPILPPAPPVSDLLAGGAGTEGGSRTGESSTSAPNMYGDAFGRNRFHFTTVLGSLSAQSQVLDFALSNPNFAANPRLPLNRNYGPGAGGGIVVVGNAAQSVKLGFGSVAGVNAYPLAIFPNASPQFTSVEPFGVIRSRIAPLQGPGGGGNITFPIADNAVYRQAANEVFNKLYGNLGATIFAAAGSNVTYSVPGDASGGAPGLTSINYQYDRLLTFDLSTPASGGVVGRTKISEDNNPLPRDRYIFGYDLFGSTQLTPDGFNVHRFSPGIEKTFFDQQASVEVRFPFASTLNPISGPDGGVSNRDTVFGNIFTSVKGLLYTEEFLHIAAGLGLAFPTAPDNVVKSVSGAELLRIKNESLILVPYLAAIYTPSDRFYWQNWVSLSFDSTGSPLVTNFEGTGPRTVGRLRDQTVLALDTQIGYWLIRPGTGEGLIQGLTPFLELHYNSSVSDASSVQSNGFNFASSDNRYDEVNLTGGVAMYLGNNLLLSTALTLPLKTGPDKFFDYQVGMRMSWFFGPTAANRNALRYGR